MNDPNFEHPELGRVVRGLESDDGMTSDEIRADLVSKGYDPDALISRLETAARSLSAKSRLSWMKHGQGVQIGLDSILSGVRSWTVRSAAEINQGFEDVLNGRYGENAQLRVQTAFSHVTELTLQSKAAFLDEVELLLALQKRSEKPETK